MDIDQDGIQDKVTWKRDKNNDSIIDDINFDVDGDGVVDIALNNRISYSDSTTSQIGDKNKMDTVTFFGREGVLIAMAYDSDFSGSIDRLEIFKYRDENHDGEIDSNQTYWSEDAKILKNLAQTVLNNYNKGE